MSGGGGGPGERVREARIARGLNQAQLGRLIDKSQQQVAKMETGKVAIHAEDLILIARALVVDPSVLLGVTNYTQAPMIGVVGAGEVVHPMPHTDRVQTLPAPAFSPPGTVVVQVAGDGLYPRYQAGDLLFLDPPKDPAHLIGDDCAVTLPDGRMLVKRVLPGSKPERWALAAISGPDVIPDVEIRECRRVKSIIRQEQRRGH